MDNTLPILVFVSLGLSIGTVVGLVIQTFYGIEDNNETSIKIRNLQDYTQTLRTLVDNRFQNMTTYIQNTNQELRNELLSKKLNTSKSILNKKTRSKAKNDQVRKSS